MRVVAPHAERGLKLQFGQPFWDRCPVAPHAGAWIETRYSYLNVPSVLSLPTRERGLKQLIYEYLRKVTTVAPHAGAWIETWPPEVGESSVCGRSPRGSVD